MTDYLLIDPTNMTENLKIIKSNKDFKLAVLKKGKRWQVEHPGTSARHLDDYLLLQQIQQIVLKIFKFQSWRKKREEMKVLEGEFYLDDRLLFFLLIWITKQTKKFKMKELKFCLLGAERERVWGGGDKRGRDDYKFGRGRFR